MARCKVVSSWQGVLYTTLYNKVCQCLATDWWFSLGTPFSSTNKTDRHDVAEVALNTIKPVIEKTLNNCWLHYFSQTCQYALIGTLKRVYAYDPRPIITSTLHIQL